MTRIHAIYEHGVFRPTEPVDLPEACEVELEARPVNGHGEAATDDDLKAIYDLLRPVGPSGEHDVAARHNEHQP
jgi:predicted DNA-binding antitoxin AbrB/MazE fold protein